MYIIIATGSCRPFLRAAQMQHEYYVEGRELLCITCTISRSVRCLRYEIDHLSKCSIYRLTLVVSPRLAELCIAACFPPTLSVFYRIIFLFFTVLCAQCLK